MYTHFQKLVEGLMHPLDRSSMDYKKMYENLWMRLGLTERSIYNDVCIIRYCIAYAKPGYSTRQQETLLRIAEMLSEKLINEANEQAITLHCIPNTECHN